MRAAQGLAVAFERIGRSRDRMALEPWLLKAGRSGIKEFRQFARVLRGDLAAIEPALTCE